MVTAICFSETLQGLYPVLQLLFSTSMQHSQLTHEPSYSLLHCESIRGWNLYTGLSVFGIFELSVQAPPSDLLVRQCPAGTVRGHYQQSGTVCSGRECQQVACHLFPRVCVTMFWVTISCLQGCVTFCCNCL